MRVIVISLNMLLILPYFDIAISFENSTKGDFVDPIRFNQMTKLLKSTDTKNSEVENNISVKEAKLSDYTVHELSKTSTTDFVNNTETVDDEIDNIHSSFNLAIIPAAAVFVFVIIICFKCCKWFRQYTRGDDKESNFYAVIVTDDDNEHIDITSDTASTVCYDTVSSSGSFLKRSGNESSFSSIKFWRQGSFKGDKGLPSNVENSKKGTNSTNSKQDLVQSTPMSNSRSKACEPFIEPDFRISSTSSAETISEQISDSPTIRRNNRFRVSFVTETKRSRANASASEIRPTSNSSFKHENPMRSSLKKSSAKTDSNETAFLFSKSTPDQALNGAVKMKDVGTQTNKSFRYSLRKSKGHVSDTDIDDRFFSGIGTGSLALVSGEIQNKDIDTSGQTINTLTKHTKHSSFSTPDEKNISLSTVIPEISNFQFDTKVDVIQNNNQAYESIVDLELEDDVFEEDLCDESSINKKEQPDLQTSCASDKEKQEDQSDIVSCGECNNLGGKDIIESICDKAKITNINVTDIGSSGIPVLCNKCRTEYGDTPTSNEVKTDGICVQNSYKSTEVHSRHSSTLSFESSGYAELSSNESCSSSPIITHRV